MCIVIVLTKWINFGKVFVSWEKAEHMIKSTIYFDFDNFYIIIIII